MIDIIATLLIVLWVVGVLSSHTMGGFIHGLVALALVLILFKLIHQTKKKP